MRLYLTRYFLSNGVIEEADGNRLTGDRTLYQVNGKGTGKSRVYSDKECHESLDEANQRARWLLRNERDRINHERTRLAIRDSNLSRLEERWSIATQEPARGEGEANG